MATPDQQAMWDALRILGFDIEDPTPDAVLVSGGQSFRERFIRDVREMRTDYDDALEHVCLHPGCGGA